MTFECRQCGQCCMYLGDYIVIEEERGPFTFLCCSVSTGTQFLAEVDGDKRHLFADRSWIEARPSACHFLRPDGDLVRCTIHRDSPPQCKAYRCVLMRICTETGEPAGIITGTFALHSEDPRLRAVYEHAMVGLRETDPMAESQLKDAITKHGYKVL